MKDEAERDDLRRTGRRHPEFGNGVLDEDRALRLLVRNISDYAIFTLTPDGRVASWNPGAERNKGYTADEIIGRDYSCFFTDAARHAGDPANNLLRARTEGVFRDEGWRVRKDGGRFWASVTIEPIHDDSGEFVGFAKITRDISKQKEDSDRMRTLLATQRRTAARLRDVAHQAKAANEAKSAFLATMSHEIRTPLNGVLGMARVISAGELEAEQRERVNILTRSGEALLTILNDVLDLSKIEAGRLELSVTPFCVSNLVATVRDTFASLVQEKGLALDVSVAPECHGEFLGDAPRLRQILTNLMSNAVKFTDSGRIGIRAEPSDFGHVHISISDTGIGVPPERLEAIFGTFVQVDSSLCRRYGGSGLGLAICRRLAEAMGGQVTAVSEPGKGSTFCLEVPLPRVSTAPARSPARSVSTAAARLKGRYEGVTVLLAEDNEVNQAVVQAMLTGSDAWIITVATGAQAVQAWLHQKLDIILMDIQMPDMDGVEATRWIRQASSGPNSSEIPIIALTANAMPHQHETYRRAGMTDCLTKPILSDALYAALDQSLNAAKIGAERYAAAPVQFRPRQRQSG